jgi:hypothetical protein
MIDLYKITGRLGNQMFQFAALYSFTKSLGSDYYCQDEKWFNSSAEQIKQIFRQGNPYEPIDKVAIHVRRGDYLKPPHNSFHTDLTSTDYYEKAIEQFPDDKFLVFSDDIEWCKTRLNGSRFSYSEGHGEIDDLNLMMQCKGHIVANSSYSWWGAYLSDQKKVICPQGNKCFKDGIIRMRFPLSWQRLEF